MTDAAESPVVVTRHENVGLLTLNRPAAINAVNEAMRRDIAETLLAFEADPDIRAIVLAGAGPRGFCAGADIREFRPAETPIETRTRLATNAYMAALASVTKPLVAAVHGVCFGAGFEMALTCDVRIAAANATFALPEVGLGLIPGAGGTQRLARIVGEGNALDLILTGDRIDAEEARRIGLVRHVVPDAADVLPRALDYAAKIAAKPPQAVRYAKEAVRKALDLDLAAGLVLERNLFALLFSSEDRIEAANAFRDKRPPRFAGR